MKKLVKISNSLTFSQISQINILNYNSNSKTNKLFQVLKSSEEFSEDDAIRQVYGNQEIKPKTWNKLKERLKHKMINTILTLNYDSKMPELNRAYNKSFKYLAVSNTLALTGNLNGAFELIKEGYQISSKYDFTDIKIQYLSKLAFHYGQLQQNPKKFDYYFKLFQENQVLYFKEQELEYFYGKLISSFNQKRSIQRNSELNSLLSSIEKKISSYEDVNTLRGKRFYFMTLILLHLFHGEYREIIKLGKQANEYFSIKPYNLITTIFNIRLFEILALIQLKELDAGNELCNYFMNKFHEGSYNWYVINYYIFILNTHTRNYEASYVLLKKIFTINQRAKTVNALEENFLIFNAYIEFLLAVGKIKRSEEEIHRRDFRLHRFLNEVPHFSKDKRGLNISLLILHVLFLLQDRKYSKIIDRVDALNQYCYRYLRRDETFRSNCFIKMLTQMVKADFNRIRTERYVEPLWKKLKSVPLHVAEQGIEVEIIPYEDLWPMVLELLD